MRALVLGVLLLSACAEAKPKPAAKVTKPEPKKKAPSKQPPPSECSRLNADGVVEKTPCK